MVGSSAWARQYAAELQQYAQADLGWDRLEGSTVLVTGATGLLGSYLVDLLLARARRADADLTVVASGRARERLQARFAPQVTSPRLVLEETRAESPSSAPPADVVFHCAGNARPETLRDDPVGTLVHTITSTDALLGSASARPGCRVVYLSSSEVYGAPRPRGAPLTEADLGPLDLHTPRSAYPVAKRAAETLCAAHVDQHGTWTAIARPAYVYGPTATADDTRVVPQFADQALKEGVVRMTGDGTLRRSYCYVGDCVSALLTIATRGTSGVAYNISDPGSVASIRDVADAVGRVTGAQVRPAGPDRATPTAPELDQGVLDPARLLGLGWVPRVPLEEGVRRTVAARRQQRR